MKSLKNFFSENIKNLGNNTNANYEPHCNDIDLRNFIEPANIFMKNYYNKDFYHISPKGEYRHEVIYNLTIVDAVYFSKELREYVYSILNKYVASKKPKYYFPDGTVAQYTITYDSYKLVLDLINHFKDCPEIQGFIDAWLIDSDEEYLRSSFH